MVAGAIKFFGRTAYAIRLPAAIAGTLTTLFTYAFVSNWFSRRIGLYAAALWAITLWPVHLSRVGFRTILLPLFVALFLWLGTLAVRWGLAQRSNIAAQPKLSQWQGNLLFLAAGFVYGMAFYTYLAVRLTPAFLVGLLIFAALTGRLRGLERGILLAGAGFVLALLPFAGTVLANPDILFGRSGQVSILSPAINGGSVWGALWRHLSGTAAMFVWQGDTILRHNVPGRPVFDWIMALPFVIGLLWCIWNWRRPAPAATLLWCGSMVWGTILAEDAPHFLRAAGLLPVLLIFPAIGLSQLGSWSKLPADLRKLLIVLLLVGSGGITFGDYFIGYTNRADTGYLFESAARELASELNRETAETQIHIDQRFANEWASVPFLISPEQPVTYFDPNSGLESMPTLPASVYVWPYDSREFVSGMLSSGSRLTIDEGALARGDLEPTAAPLYVRYHIVSAESQGSLEQQSNPTSEANFANVVTLLDGSIVSDGNATIDVNLLWQAEQPPTQPLTAFVHVLDNASGTLVGQIDAPLGGPHWFDAWWQPSLQIEETRKIALTSPYNAETQHVIVGVYNSETVERLPIFGENGAISEDFWRVTP